MNRHALRQKLPAGLDLKFLLVSAICCFGAWSFVEIADDASEGDYLQLEEKILASLREPDAPEDPIGPQWLEETALGLTALGSLPVLFLITGLVCGHLLLVRRYRTALYLAVAAAAGGGLTFYLKLAYARPRPEIVPPLAEVSTHSFPSGHTMTSTIIFMTLGALLAQSASRQREKLYFISVALLLSFIIGLTRVYLGVHYPTDVMAGWAAGTAWALLCWSVVRWLKSRKKRRDQDPRERL